MATPIVPEPAASEAVSVSEVRKPKEEPPKPVRRIADWLHEASILLAVFGWLEPYHRGGLTFASLAFFGALSAVAFALGLAVDRRS